jgi:hypothetical protein
MTDQVIDITPTQVRFNKKAVLVAAGAVTAVLAGLAIRSKLNESAVVEVNPEA